MGLIKKIYEKTVFKLPEILIIAGIVLRVKRWLENRSLWLDEAYLGMHLMSKPWKGLLLNERWASDFPVPPMGFMLAEKISTVFFGNNELALRLFPLLCGIAAIFLFYTLAKKILSFRLMVLALAFFVFNDVLIDYSAELKQYSTDLFIMMGLGLLFFFRTDKWLEIKTQDMLLFALAGAVAVTFSHPAVFILAAFGISQQGTLLYKGKIEAAKRGVICGAAWLMTFLFWYKISFRGMSSNPELIESVTKPGFMLNVPFGSFASIQWFIGRLIDIFNNVVFLAPFWLSFLLFVTGAAVLIKRNLKAFYIFILPLVFAFLAGLSGKYLLGGRFSMFMVPGILICVVSGLDFIMTRFNRKGVVLCGVCAAVFFVGIVPPTWGHFINGRKKEETREFARYVQENFVFETDALMVNGSGHLAMWYYFGQNGKFQIPEVVLVSDEAFKEKNKDIIFLARAKFGFKNGYAYGFETDEQTKWMSVEGDLDIGNPKRIWFFGGHLKGSQHFILEYFLMRGIRPTVYEEKQGALLMMFEVLS